MTSSSVSTEQDSGSGEDYDLGRFTVLVGDTALDVGIPTEVSIASIVDEVVELEAVRRKALHGARTTYESHSGKITFARLTGEPIASELSLSEAEVCDGDVLLIRDATEPWSAPLVDRLSVDDSAGGRRQWSPRQQRTVGWLTLSLGASTVLAAVLARAASIAPAEAAAALVVGIGCAAAACAVALRSDESLRSIWLGGLGLSLTFGSSLCVIPGAVGTKSLPMALALTALTATVMLLIGKRGLAFYTAVITLACLAEPSTVVQLLWTPSPRTVGALLATTAVVTVYLAPRATILLARLPIPRVPTAGEPLDEIETHGGTAVEGVSAIGKQVIPTEASLGGHVTRARDQLSGTLSAAAVLAVVGCYETSKIIGGFSWQGTLFALAVAAVLCLRGRTHHDLSQSAALIGAGLLIAVVVILNTATDADGWRLNAAAALSALMALLVVCGLIAPSIEFSPLSRRWAEVLESVAIVTVFPLAFSIMHVYGVFRELRL